MILFISGTASCKLYRRAKNWQLHMVLGYLVQDISWDFWVLFLVSRLTQSAFVSEIDNQSLGKELTAQRLYPLCFMIGSILWDLTNGRHWLELKRRRERVRSGVISSPLSCLCMSLRDGTPALRLSKNISSLCPFSPSVGNGSSLF